MRAPVAAVEDPERRLLDERSRRVAAVLDEREAPEARHLAERVVRGRAEARVPVDVDERPGDPDRGGDERRRRRQHAAPARGTRASRRPAPRARRGGSATCARSAARRPSRRTRPARRRRAPSRATASRARHARASQAPDRGRQPTRDVGRHVERFQHGGSPRAAASIRARSVTRTTSSSAAFSGRALAAEFKPPKVLARKRASAARSRDA